MAVNVSEQVVNMLSVFLAVSLASERVTEVIKNAVRSFQEKRCKVQGREAAQPEETPEYCKFVWRGLAILIGSLIAYSGRDMIWPLLATFFPGKTCLGGWDALIIGLFSAAGSEIWSQLLSIIKEYKEAKRTQLTELRANLPKQ